jgi:hypothetical protein
MPISLIGAAGSDEFQPRGVVAHVILVLNGLQVVSRIVVKEL